MTKAQIDRRIVRRIEFLIKEAQSEDEIADQAVTNTLRVVTNYLSVDCDARSRALSAKCHYRSKKAHALYLKYKKLNDQKGWLDEVTNEHLYPIKRAWTWMKNEGDKLNVRRVKSRLKKWPVVVVTKEENKRLRDDPDKGPDQRYLDAGIKVLKEIKPEVWRPWRSPNQISD